MCAGTQKTQAYRMLQPRFKYTRVFCGEEEIELAERIRQFVDQEVMPHRHDLEGGWHHDEQLALQTLHRLYARLVDLGVTKSNLPEKYGGLGLSPVVRQMINEELARGDIGLATMVGKIHWIVSFMLAAKRDDLLQEFVPRIVSQESWTACVAITEPAGGANLEDPALECRTVRTIAHLEGDEYRLKGHKIGRVRPAPLSASTASIFTATSAIGRWPPPTPPPVRTAWGSFMCHPMRPA